MLPCGLPCGAGTATPMRQHCGVVVLRAVLAQKQCCRKKSTLVSASPFLPLFAAALTLHYGLRPGTRSPRHWNPHIICGRSSMCDNGHQVPFRGVTWLPGSVRATALDAPVQIRTRRQCRPNPSVLPCPRAGSWRFQFNQQPEPIVREDDCDRREVCYKSVKLPSLI